MLEADASTRQEMSTSPTRVPVARRARDTIALADRVNAVDRAPTAWAAHLDYLRDLQRVGRERLARLT